MAKVQVITKHAEIDGKPIKWKVIAIVGSVGGNVYTLELKPSKAEINMAEMILESKEDLKVAVRNAEIDDIIPTRKSEEKPESDNWLE